MFGEEEIGEYAQSSKKPVYGRGRRGRCGRNVIQQRRAAAALNPAAFIRPRTPPADSHDDAPR
jgi:hypothetical protein